jgi:hypothetical protein
MVRVAREGRSSLSSYLAAKSSRRLFVNQSAFSARWRQRSACSFKNELSIVGLNTQLTPMNLTHTNGVVDFINRLMMTASKQKEPPEDGLSVALKRLAFRLC